MGNSWPLSYLSTINWLLIALHYHSQCYCGHSIVLIPETFLLLLSVTIIGQGSLLLLPLSCLLKAMFLVNSRSPRFYAPSLDSFLSNLLSHFAEFLKDISSATSVFSTRSLVSDWYSSFTRFFLIFFLVYPLSFLFRLPWLRGCFLLNPWTSGLLFYFDFCYSYLHRLFRFFTNWSATFSLVSVEFLAASILGAVPVF